MYLSPSIYPLILSQVTRKRCAHELTKTAKLSDVPSVQINKAEGVLEHATQKVLNMSLQDITVGKVTQHHVDRVTTPTDQPVKTA